MKNNNLNDKQLNNLFEQIKKSEPLLSREESAEIIKNTHTFGVKKMIGIGSTMAAVAAVLVTGLFFPTEKEDIQNSTNIQQKPQEQAEILPVKELEEQPRDENLSAKKVERDEQEEQNENNIAWAEKVEKIEKNKKDNNPERIATKQVQINSIPVRISAWKELGFVTSGNELKFSSFKDTPENTIVILGENNYDLKMSSDENIENKIYPAFVSNEKGERIISLFVNADDGLRMSQLVKTETKNINNKELISTYKEINNDVDFSNPQTQEMLEQVLGEENISEDENGHKKYIVEKNQMLIINDDVNSENSDSKIRKIVFINDEDQSKMTQSREYTISSNAGSEEIEKIITTNIVQNYSDETNAKNIEIRVTEGMEKEEYPKIKYELDENGEKQIIFPIKLNKFDLNTDVLKDSNINIAINSIINNYVETDTLIFSDKSNPDSPVRKIIKHKENELLKVNESSHSVDEVIKLFNNIRAKNHFNNDKPIEMSRIAFDMLNEPTEDKDDDEKYSSMIFQQRVLVIEGDGSRTNDYVKVVMEAPVGTKFIVEYNPIKLLNVDRNKHSDRDILEMYLEKLKEIEFDRDIPIVMNRTAYTYLYNLQGEWKTQDSVHYNQKIIIKGEDGERLNGELSFKIPAVKETFNTFDYVPKKTGTIDFKKHDVNKLIPMSVDLGKKKYILWFRPTNDFVKAIPRSLQETLRPEIEALRKDETAQCGGTDFGAEAVMDVWKGCSGAIQNMKIYPNPAKISSNIEFDLDEGRTLDISIVDLSGRIIKQITSGETLNPGQIEKAISLENVSPGMYYVKITSEIGESALQRIIVN
jgi:Secretion system C-terminal sorting domain